MPPFKDELSAEAVGRLGTALTTAWPDFDAVRFVDRATAGLEELELKARAAQIAGVLTEELPSGIEMIERLVDRALRDPTFDGWMLWPFLDAVAEVTHDAPDRGLALLRRLTPRWTAEGAVRGFIASFPDTAFGHFDEWVTDPDEHVRRLVSEGTRPRLPWSARIPALTGDPSRSIALLNRLRDDPSEYVRRSVANHLNDIAKDHPDRALEVAREWRAHPGPHTDRLLRHGLRGLVKAGDPSALELVGVHVGASIELAGLSCDPATVPIGESTRLTVTLVNTGDSAAAAEVDLRVHYANAQGMLTRRATFKGATRTLVPGVETIVARTVRFQRVSIRAIFPGRHLIELQVNGRILGAIDVHVH